MARREGRYIAGALNFIGGDTLYGRNWGCLEDHPFLHFELCYYQAIDFAIARGLARVEAGAQGTHKLARGYAPHHIYSAHHIAHEGLRDAVAHYLDGERDYVDREIEALGRHTPFRRPQNYPSHTLKSVMVRLRVIFQHHDNRIITGGDCIAFPVNHRVICAADIVF